MSYYIESVTLSVDATKVTTEQCIDFVEKLSAGNRHYLNEAGIDNEERITILSSLVILDAIKSKLFELQIKEQD